MGQRTTGRRANAPTRCLRVPCGLLCGRTSGQRAYAAACRSSPPPRAARARSTSCSRPRRCRASTRPAATAASVGLIGSSPKSLANHAADVGIGRLVGLDVERHPTAAVCARTCAEASTRNKLHGTVKRLLLRKKQMHARRADAAAAMGEACTSKDAHAFEIAAAPTFI